MLLQVEFYNHAELIENPIPFLMEFHRRTEIKILIYLVNRSPPAMMILMYPNTIHISTLCIARYENLKS